MMKQALFLGSGLKVFTIDAKASLQPQVQKDTQ